MCVRAKPIMLWNYPQNNILLNTTDTLNFIFTRIRVSKLKTLSCRWWSLRYNFESISIARAVCGTTSKRYVNYSKSNSISPIRFTSIWIRIATVDARQNAIYWRIVLFFRTHTYQNFSSFHSIVSICDGSHMLQPISIVSIDCLFMFIRIQCCLRTAGGV